MGRINRSTFFLGFVLSLIPGFLMIFLFSISDFWGFLGMAFYAFWLASLEVRRLHDTSQSGWWALLSIPPFTQFMIIYLLLAGGKSETNKYGDPQGKISLFNALLNRSAN